MYLDNSATTRVNDEVLEEMLPYFNEEFGNPSTLYSIGRESKKALELANELDLLDIESDVHTFLNTHKQ